MNLLQRNDCQTSYDAVADEYVRRIYDELQHKPLDRQLLDRFAASMHDVGPACDMGCGPGHVARYLHEQGVQICGVDLSPALVERARSLNAGVEFRQGDMMKLADTDAAFAGIVAFYSLIHIPRDDMVRTLTELRRVLMPGGLLLVAFHIGDETKHLDEWWGQQVCVDFHSFQSTEMSRWLAAAGFEIEEIIEREPYLEIEHQSRRGYIFARRRASRVQLEPLTVAHAEEMFAVLADPAIYTYIANRPPASVAALADRYRRLESRASPDGSQHWLNWAIRRVEDQQCNGYVQATIHPAATADFAFVLAPSFWGLGLAREASAAALSLLFTQLGVTSVFATVDRRNLRSSALLRRLGFQLVPAASYPHGTAEESDDVFQLNSTAISPSIPAPTIQPNIET